MIALVWLFILGAGIGSLLNVCIARLPQEKSVLWPLTSRCGTCYQRIAWYDNLPLVSYLRLRGRCRTCGARFSPRYLLVELGTAVGFVLLFYLEIVQNWYGIELFRERRYAIRTFDISRIPWEAWAFFLHHAVLLCLLIVAAACDMDRREIPLSVTIPGTVIGLAGAALFPWPWPNDPSRALAALPSEESWYPLRFGGKIPLGLYPWPVWGPLPEGLPPGSWQLGLVTGLMGALFGLFLVRAVRFLCNRGLGMEALGLGDADLMMAAGAFLGWQPVLAAFFLGAVAALVMALPSLFLRGENSLPFGPGLAVGIVLAWFWWPSMGPHLQIILFDKVMLIVVGGLGAVLLFLLTFLMRRKE
ncbi:MAG TPA: prepilin peptidase [Gemmataceae bacterium]